MKPQWSDNQTGFPLQLAGELPHGPSAGGAPRSATASWLAVLVPGFTLWFEATLVLACCDSFSYVALAAAILGMFGLYLTLPILSRPVWFRSALALVGLLLLVRLAFFPPLVLERGFVAIPRVLTISVAECLLWCQVVVLWRWRSGSPLPVSFAGLALLTAVVALNKTLPGNTRSAHVLLIVVSLLIPTLLATRSQRIGGSKTAAMPWNVRFAVAAICVAMLTGTWLATEAWSRWLPDAQRWFANRVGRIQVERNQMQVYSADGNLTTIRRQNASNPTAEALKVYSDKRPGYLAGRIFDTYRNGRWTMIYEEQRLTRTIGGQPTRETPQPTRKIPPLREIPEQISRMYQPTGRHSMFQIAEPTDWDALHMMMINNDPRRGRVYFTPLGCCYFAGSGSSLRIDEYGIVRGNFSVRKPYIAIADATHAVVAPESTMRQMLLRRPRLDRRIELLSQQICAGADSPSEKMKAVRDYFQDNYEYTLKSYGDHPGYDPIEHFLLEGDAAHCEFFATAAVILLRHQGVPARYVTGYRVMQLDEDSGEYWTALNRDAHAWAEAYDDQQQKWVIVEATPGFSDPAEDGLNTGDEETANALGAGLALAAEGASEWLQWWDELPAALRRSILTLLILLLGAALFFSARRVRGLQSRFGREVTEQRIRPWLRLLRIMDRRMKRHGVTRLPAETMYQFADRIHNLDGDQKHALQAAAKWYRDYANSRFRPMIPEPPPLPHN